MPALDSLWLVMPNPSGEVYLVDPGHEARWKRGWVAVVHPGKDHGDIRRITPEDRIALESEWDGDHHLWMGTTGPKGYMREEID